MKAGRYAAGTGVAITRTREEIDKLLQVHGATGRGVMVREDVGLAQIVFIISGRSYRVEVPLPRASEFAKPKTPPRGWSKWDEARRTSWREAQADQASRERWRAVLLVLKAKLELVRIGVSKVEHEFFADLVLPGGERLGSFAQEEIEKAMKTGHDPRFLLGPSSERKTG